MERKPDRMVDPTELARASHMRPGDPRITILSEVSGLNKLSRIYAQFGDLKDLDFIEAVFRELTLELEVDTRELEHLPREGGLVFVANHPYGAIDGLALVSILSRARPDIRVMANYLLQQLEPLRERFIGVNPFEKLRSRSSFQGMRAAREHVAQGGALALFPAGEVSSYRTEFRAVADPRWKLPALKLIQRTEAPVVPVWFDGSNSLIFQMLGMIHPELRTMALPKEMLRMRGRSVRMRIGKPIPYKDLKQFSSADQMGRFLRAKTYALGSGVMVRRELFRPLRFPSRPRPIIDPVDTGILRTEVAGLSDRLLNSQGEFDLYLASAHRMPNMLREIGRCRELTFREVGEGTNKRVDSDEFDLYYDHLFLWDREKECLAGAYRVGDGERIMERYGKRGFYSYSLFRMDRHMDRVLSKSFELGRSFILKRYQRHRLPLFLLWRGLLIHVLGHPDHRYLIGPVSISNNYSRFARSLIFEFVKQHHFDEEMATHVRPRNRFRIKPDKADGEVLLQAATADLKKLDRIVSEVEPSGLGLPVLLKKYIGLNARVVGFNSDPRFNDALDGLIVLDLKQVPERVVEDLQKGMNDQAVV
ncbi:MAG: lysophospholipid acyltransferase family protein [Flavobacteriales bacterium]|nr:lysophospholipid acyltransferase family protein [Flavobacteriales bacterium]